MRRSTYRFLIRLEVKSVHPCFTECCRRALSAPLPSPRPGSARCRERNRRRRRVGSATSGTRAATALRGGEPARATRTRPPGHTIAKAVDWAFEGSPGSIPNPPSRFWCSRMNRDGAPDRLVLVRPSQCLEHGAGVVDVALAATRPIVEAAVAVLLVREPVDRARADPDSSRPRGKDPERGEVRLTGDRSVGPQQMLQRCNQIAASEVGQLPEVRARRREGRPLERAGPLLPATRSPAGSDSAPANPSPRGSKRKRRPARVQQVGWLPWRASEPPIAVFGLDQVGDRRGMRRRRSGSRRARIRHADRDHGRQHSRSCCTRTPAAAM